MSRLGFFFLLLCLPFSASFAAQPPPVDTAGEPPPVIPDASPASDRASSIVSKPSMASLVAKAQQAADELGLRKIETVAEVDYDAQGAVLDARLLKSTGHDELDQAILDFCRRLQLTPGKAGTGKLPFEFSLGDEHHSYDLSDKIVTKPPLREVAKIAARSGVADFSGRIFLEYDDTGAVVVAVLVGSSGNGDLDTALSEWAKQVKLKSGARGTGFLPVSVVSRH
jgi:TonB family protein